MSSQLDSKPDQAPDESEHVLYLYETRRKIYARRFKGFFRKLKKRSSIPMLLAYFLTPWIQIDGRQAVLFDLPARKFHIFWITFWPQDFMLLGWMLIICALALFAITILVGRVWCGFVCPQTVWTMMFMGVEHFFEGGRNKRIRLDMAPWTFEKVWRKTGKHAGWVLIALVSAYTFVGYFNPIRELSSDMLSFSAHPAALFWIGVIAVMTYMNAGHLREQVCKYMCPYARFQSVMFDSDTMVVSYDESRGEPRGARRRGGEQEAGKGDCVDCGLCVQVCPVGIDIREGLQYECISCGLCIDACDAIMDKVGSAPKLISFTTENKLHDKQARLFRPRLLGYGAGLMVMMSLFFYALATRTPVELDVVRDRALLYRETSRGLIENIYTLRISNMDNRNHEFLITADGDYQFRFIGQEEISVLAGEVVTHVVRLELDPGFLRTGNTDVNFVITAGDDETIRDTETSRFIGPFLR
ncbi:MAG TPA: cytochrome c oxidase accessory protein CcoG [Porticoccaceae bacterium]|nr:cytochrome c oxidase accessory protein CcoG [Porticoccaceae bacterium]HCO61263.1 cytochrome c oxidase accessory protein CcoG [Porticoccaceae bacterium]